MKSSAQGLYVCLSPRLVKPYKGAGVCVVVNVNASYVLPVCAACAPNMQCVSLADNCNHESNQRGKLRTLILYLI